MKVRTDYSGHDEVYQRLRSEPGRRGWNSEQQWAEESLELDRMMSWPEFPARGRLLEIGCGAGQQALKMATHGFEVEGVDVSSTAVRWAEEHALELGIAAAFRVADVRTLADFADDSFDVVLDGRCLHCIIGNDRQLVLDAVRRVLRSGGVFVVRTMCDPNPDSPPPNFDLETYCAMRPDAADVATRYIGPAAAILDELGGAGFELVRHDHVREPGATTADLLAIMRTTD